MVAAPGAPYRRKDVEGGACHPCHTGAIHVPLLPAQINQVYWIFVTKQMGMVNSIFVYSRSGDGELLSENSQHLEYHQYAGYF